MQKELYFDISSEESGGSLYRLKDGAGKVSFIYNHSTYNAESDEIKIFETVFSSFAAFWQMITQNKEWFYLHPLFIHQEQRAFISEQLQHANWAIHHNVKWQLSHQKQWKKVLGGNDNYYQSNK